MVAYPSPPLELKTQRSTGVNDEDVAEEASRLLFDDKEGDEAEVEDETVLEEDPSDNEIAAKNLRDDSAGVERKEEVTTGDHEVILPPKKRQLRKKYIVVKMMRMVARIKPTGLDILVRVIIFYSCTVFYIFILHPLLLTYVDLLNVRGRRWMLLEISLLVRLRVSMRMKGLVMVEVNLI